MIGSMKVSDNGNKVIINGLEYNKTIHFQSSGPNLEESILPYKFYKGSAVFYNNELHLLGGFASDTKTKHYVYNGSTWSSKSTLPFSFYFGSAVVLNDEIHILSGRYSLDRHYLIKPTIYMEV